jgi:hypothetical protein
MDNAPPYRQRWFQFSLVAVSLSMLLVVAPQATASADDSSHDAVSGHVEQVTFGSKQHLVGCGPDATPWNKSGRYIVALRLAEPKSDETAVVLLHRFSRRMPTPDEVAEIVLLDTQADYKAHVVGRTRAFNFSDGPMLVWNPSAPENQVLYNDRDAKSGMIFCTLLDFLKSIEEPEMSEFRFAEAPIGIAAMSHGGDWFIGINYARLARLRPNSGYAGSRDWTSGQPNPRNDGIFKVDIRTKEKKLIVSFDQLADALRAESAFAQQKELFVDRLMISPDDGRLFFYARAGFDKPNAMKDGWLNAACTVRPDGSDLQIVKPHPGKSPAWIGADRLLAGLIDGDGLVTIDTAANKVVETLMLPNAFPKKRFGDDSASPEGRWFVRSNAAFDEPRVFTILRRSDGECVATTVPGFDVSTHIRWNRESTRFLVSGSTEKDPTTRQLFLVSISSKGE